MKLKVILTALLFLSCALQADTLYTYGGDYVPEWKVQVVYKEKYFENSVYYKKFGVIGFFEEKDPAYTSVLRGMRHNFILRMGLPEDFSVNIDFLYIYQKIDLYNLNNLQALAVFTEKYFDWWGALAGVRVPFENSMPFDDRLYDSREELSLMLGLFVKSGPGFFRYSAGIYSETCLVPGKNYQESLLATVSAGLKLYSSEYQNIDFNLETAWRARFMADGTSSVLYLTPQFYVEFFNDFYFIVGAEFYLAASEIAINDFFKPVYLIKINYTANSDKRTVKAVEVKKPEAKVKIWWQIEGVDDEMVPESWKDEANRKENQIEVK